MSFASTLRPAAFAFGSPLHGTAPSLTATDIPFQHEPSYLQLHRMLTRYQNVILLIPSPNSQQLAPSYDLTPLQRQIQAELYCPLPYHRTKWLHMIESARNLLLTLERQAQSIKATKTKREALKDLAGKRQLIKRLRSRVEEIGREVESMGDRAWDIRKEEDEQLLGERVDIVLGNMGADAVKRQPQKNIDLSQELKEGKPVEHVSQQTEIDAEDLNGSKPDRDALFGSAVRRRNAQGQSADARNTSPVTDKGTSSGFSNLAQTEQSLQAHAHEHEDITSALVSMAAQLKQQSRAFQFSLSQDDNFLNRAMEGLDRNLTGMEAASKNMAFLRRMSEEQGFLGRLKLYAIILGMWVIAILLVFVGPKLRF